MRASLNGAIYFSVYNGAYTSNYREKVDQLKQEIKKVIKDRLAQYVFIANSSGSPISRRDSISRDFLINQSRRAQCGLDRELDSIINILAHKAAYTLTTVGFI